MPASGEAQDVLLLVATERVRAGQEVRFDYELGGRRGSYWGNRSPPTETRWRQVLLPTLPPACREPVIHGAAPPLRLVPSPQLADRPSAASIEAWLLSQGANTSQHAASSLLVGAWRSEERGEGGEGEGGGGEGGGEGEDGGVADGARGGGDAEAGGGEGVGGGGKGDAPRCSVDRDTVCRPSPGLPKDRGAGHTRLEIALRTRLGPRTRRTWLK